MRTRPVLRSLARPALLLALLLATAPALAWGRLGHRLVAELAWEGMTPTARAAALDLLQGEADPSLPGVANWADELRATDAGLGRRSARWHYVNIGGDGCEYEAIRDCPRGNCVVAAINAQAKILADRGRSDAERLQALKFVVHFVGDVHQPLHAGRAADRGGNTHQVNVGGEGSNLHALWDSGMLGATGLDEAAWLARLRQSPLPDGASAGFTAASPVDWAEGSCRIVDAPGFYPPVGTLPAGYIEHWLPVAERQLRRGGVELAQVLNTALGG